jgi:hypothetical protein
LIAATLAFAALVSWGCETTKEVTLVNPSDQPLFVQINERAPIEIAPGGSAKSTVPALERIATLNITARDGRGQTVFFVATSVSRLEQQGMRIELVQGPAVNPWGMPTPHLPQPAQ